MSAVTQPSGTVTLMFTDIEGSTRLLEKLGTDVYREALAEHRRVVREACARHDGYEVDCEGDAFFVTFHTAPAAVAAVTEAMQGLEGGPIRIRVGIHTGQPGLDGPNYIGLDVHRAARIMAAAHGGQVVVSRHAAELLDGIVELKDLGEHRFKDLDAPERIYQLGQREHPRLRSLYHVTLPVPATPFLGRQHELAQVVQRLTDPDTRLLTLTGPGGTGKTRLALQAAATASDHYPDGTTWIPLAPLRDPTLVVPSIATALELREQPEQPLIDTLAQTLLGKQALLLLDNLEHLLPDAARELAALLQACPTLKLLVTSRERLAIAAESAWPVPPLTASDGERLFIERAHAAGVDLSLDDTIRELCGRLDQLPLALELAAARAVLFAPAQLLERLGQRLDLLEGPRDSDPRQRTLRSTIAWSYDLLLDEEKQLFRHLSVFAAGCDYDAAEHVAGAEPDTLQSLLDKSLLRRRDAKTRRYWQLESVRQFGRSKLDEHGEAAATLDRHLEWILEHVRETAPAWVRASDTKRVEALLVEEEDIMAALSWALDKPDVDRALELCGRMGRAWIESGRCRIGLSATGPALSCGAGTPELVAGALLTAGLLAWTAGSPSGNDQVAAARAIYRERGCPWEVAVTQMFLGANLAQDGDASAGVELLEQSVAEFERLGDFDGQRVARGNLADALRYGAVTREELQRVATLLRETLALDRVACDRFDEIVGLASLSEVLLRLGEAAEAKATGLEAVAVMRALGAPRMLAHLSVALAEAATALGRFEEATILAAASEPIATELGQPLTALEHERVSRIRHGTHTLRDEAHRDAAHRGSAMTVEELLDYLATLSEATN